MQFVAPTDPVPAAFPPFVRVTTDAFAPEEAGPPLLGRVLLDLRPQRQRGRWALQLDAAVAAAPRRTVAVAHGLACLALTYWAQLSPSHYFSNLLGAVLIAPADPATATGYAFAEAPHTRLPFPTLVASDGADGNGTAGTLAALWGGQLIGLDQLERGGWPWLEAVSHLPVGMA